MIHFHANRSVIQTTKGCANLKCPNATLRKRNPFSPVVMCHRLNSLGAAAVIVAALCHDVGHPGRNNAFFSTGRSPLVSVFGIFSTGCTRQIVLNPLATFYLLSLLTASSRIKGVNFALASLVFFGPMHFFWGKLALRPFYTTIAQCWKTSILR